jgi:hypothetical protein
MAAANPDPRHDGEQPAPQRIVVKLRDDFQIGYADAAQRQLTGGDLKFWRALEASLIARKLEPPSLDRLFTALSGEQIAALVAKARRLDPTWEPPNLLRFFVVPVPRGLDPALLLALFVSDGQPRWEALEYAYVEPLARPAVPCFTPNAAALTADQGYLNGPPALPAAGNIYGVNALAAWNDGGCGGGVRVVDLEVGYTPHSALPAIAAVAGVAASGSSGDQEHGTNSLGVIAAQGGAGQTAGIAPLAQIGFASNYDPIAGLSNRMDDALLAAIANASALPLRFGDVLLIEVEQLSGMPIEALVLGGATHSVFHLIRLATALGITVIEPAGNAGSDIAAAVAAGDSGAVIVGASLHTHPFNKAGLSNHGSRVNCYAWGEEVYTCSGASAYADFSGTSSASAIIAGAAAALQSAANAALGHKLSPQQLRVVLADPATGIASATNATTHIGVMPNLGAVIPTLAGKADPYLRDHVADVGDPHVGAISASPDIILRNALSANPAVDFGVATEANNNLGQPALTGQDNYLYVRLKNRGGAAATSVNVRVYWSPPGASLIDANLWLPNLIGTATIASVPAGNALTVITTPITWLSANIPAPGHYCFIAIVDCAQDPGPNPVDFLDLDNFFSFIRDNNNVTWRNFDVSAPAMGMRKMFIMPAAPDRDERFDLEFVADLPPGARLLLEVPTHFVALLGQAGRMIEIDDTERVAVELAPHGRVRFRDLPLKARQGVDMTVRALIPEQYWEREHEVYVRQLWRGEPLGRLTWRFSPVPAGQLPEPVQPCEPPVAPKPCCGLCECICRVVKRLFGRV